jgi:AcrR family transcriptional regulator
MTLAEPRKRTRLAPEVRRSQILDDAARLILEEGLSAVSMERLGRESGVSKALVYNYFPSREVLLASLLHREQADLDSRGIERALEAKSYEELIRQTTRVYLEHTSERGALIQTLLADPSVARLMEAESAAGLERTVRYFVRETRREYGLSREMALLAVQMLMAMTDRAGKLVAEGQVDIPTAEEMCVQIITGGAKQLAARLGPSIDE